MNKASQNLLPLIPAPESLSGKISLRIRSEVKKAAWRLACLIGALALGALSALLALVRTLILEAGSSGAFQYLSLVFSDTGLSISHWKEILLSILESIPAATLGLSLLSLFALLLLSRLFTENFARYSGGFRAA